MKYWRVLLLAPAVWGTFRIRIGVDDSVLNTTVSVDRVHITTTAVQRSVINPKGVKVEREEGAVLDSSQLALYFPLQAMLQTKEEVEARHPFVQVTVDENDRGKRTFKFATLHTELPETYLYGEYLKGKILKQKKEGESVQKVYVTARGYTSGEEKVRIGEAIKSSVATGEVEVIPDGTSLALQYLAPGYTAKVVQSYVFRGDKVVASLFQYTPNKEGKGGELKNLYHDVYDVYNENELYTKMAEYVQAGVQKIVQKWKQERKQERKQEQGQKPEIKEIEFYPRVGYESSLASAHAYNQIELLNKVILGLNNGFYSEESQVEFEEIVLEGADGSKVTIVPEEGSPSHRLDLAGLKETIVAYLRARTEAINGMLRAVRAKSREQLGESSADPEELVYNDIFIPGLFQQLLDGVEFTEQTRYLKKSHLSEGGVQAGHWGMKIVDSAARVVSGKPSSYKINGKNQLCSSIASLLEKEQRAALTIASLLSSEAMEAKQHPDLKNFSASERKELEMNLKQRLGNMSPSEFKKSPQMAEMIGYFYQVVDQINSREETVAQVKQKVAAVLAQVSEGEDLVKEAASAIPKEAAEFQKFMTKKAQEVASLQHKAPSKAVKKLLDRIQNALGYRLQKLRQDHDQHLEAARAAEDQAKRQAAEGTAPDAKEAERASADEPDEATADSATASATADEPAPALPNASPSERDGENKLEPGLFVEQEGAAAVANDAVIDDSTPKDRTDSFDNSMPNEKPHLQVDL